MRIIAQHIGAGECLSCGYRPLVQNPVHRHWRHCPVCEPDFVTAITAMPQHRPLVELMNVGLPHRN